MHDLTGLLTAFSQLELFRFGETVSASELDSYFAERDLRIKPDVIIQYDPSVTIARSIDTGVRAAGYPDPASNSILKFKYINEVGSLITHYALYDTREETNEYIIDTDGHRKAIQDTPYGPPVGYYEYTKQGFVAPVTAPTPPPPVEPETPQVFTEATDTHGIKYQALQVHRRMYVNKNPANKYHFDEIITHMDAPRKVVEKVAYGTPVYVVMEAQHPIPPTGAVYYMDAEAVGDFKHTGHVSAAIGFNKSDLSDGIAPGKPEPKPEVVKPQLVNNVIDATVAKLPGRTSTSAAKASLDTSYAGVYELLQNIPIREIDGQRDPVEPGQGARMHILGFFTYDGQTYGKPDVGEKLNKHGWWYMVPIAALTQVEKEAHYQDRIAEKLAQEDAIMDEPITIADKVPRSLTKKEQLLLALGTIIASWHNHQTKKLKKIGDK